MKKRKIKNLFLVKSSVANLNSTKHGIKGGENSAVIRCAETAFPEQCDPNFTQVNTQCGANCTTAPTNQGCNTNNTCLSFPLVCDTLDRLCIG